MEVENYIENIKCNDFKNYLGNYKIIIENNNKCIKSKKCQNSLTFTNNEIILNNKNKIKKLKIPKYIIVDKRLKEIEELILELEKKIRFYHNVITKDYDKKIINEYRNMRDKYFELEKEKQQLSEYLYKINEIEKREIRAIEIENELLKINLEKRKIYNEIVTLNSLKGSKKFKENIYEKKIKLYIDNNEKDKLIKEKKDIESFNLISDELLSKKNKDRNSKINYIVKNINMEKKIKIVKDEEKNEKQIKLKIIKDKEDKY